MSNENDGNPPPANSEPPAQPNPPSYVTPDQLNQAMAPVMQGFQTLQEAMRLMASARNTDPMTANQPTPIVLPTEEELVADVQAGSVGKLKQFINGSIEAVRRESQASMNNGMAIVAEQSKQVAILNGSMPHYSRFKKEIDAACDKIHPSQRGNAEVYKGIHDLIVGQNFKVLLTETNEAAVRAAAAAANDNTTLPGSQGGRQPKVDPNKIPSVADIYGEDAVAALGMLGRGGKSDDQFAQSMGYESWAKYYTDVLKPQGIGVSAHA